MPIPVDPFVTLREIGPDNLATCHALEVTEEQSVFVARPAEYLALCARNDSTWEPLVAYAGKTMVGFVMWGRDPADGAFWIGGLLVDRRHQQKGYGRAIVEALVERARAGRYRSVALSYKPANTVGKALYASLGFKETGEMDDGELVARRPLAGP